jgi:preprotein translocase subunit SecD
VSPPSSRGQSRRQRNLWISVIACVVISLGSFALVVGAKWTPRLGLDLAGGLAVTYQTAKPVAKSELDETVTILNNRVNGLGVSGAQVSTSGNDQISVAIPGVTNGNEVLAAIGKTAQLYFRPVLCFAPDFEPSKSAPAKPATAPLPACGSSYATNSTNLAVTPNSSAQGYSSNNLPADPSFASYPTTKTGAANYPNENVLLPALGGGGRMVLGPQQLTGNSIASATAEEDQTGAWTVNYSLTGAGSPKWDTVAEKNFHQYLALELDGVVQSAPLIQPTEKAFSSFDGKGEISGGGITQQSAQQLALAMQFGSLPVRLHQLTTETVSPTLGKSSLKAGLAAGVAGLILVLLYVLIYYRGLGLVIISGLVLTACLLWAIISALGHTKFSPSFDLAGITGLIVSIGITVDSYIVYFERLKDETRAGRTVRTSVDRGFKSAWRTVLAADLVSLAAAVVLYLVAVGDVKGFAFFLGLSTLLDIFFTWFYTRPLVILLGRNERITSARTFGIAKGLAVSQGAEA